MKARYGTILVLLVACHLIHAASRPEQTLAKAHAALLNKNTKQAHDYFEEAYNQSDNQEVCYEAALHLAYLILTSKEWPKNVEHAYSYCQTVAQQDINKTFKARALCGLGWIHYYDDKGFFHDKKRAHDYFIEVINQYDDEYAQARANCMLGMIYYHGEGAEQDRHKAHNYFVNGSNQKVDMWAYARSLFFLVLYEHAANNRQKVLSYQEFLAQQTVDTVAQVHAALDLGYAYYCGQDYPKDYEQAKKYFEIAYASTLPSAKIPATYFLGELYYHGNGVAIDYARALSYFEELIDQTSNVAYKARACSWIGALYAYGLHGEYDDMKALDYLTQAAESSDVWARDRASLHLGYLHAYGKQIIQDKSKAKNYLNQAAMAQDSWTKTKAEELLSSL